MPRVRLAIVMVVLLLQSLAFAGVGVNKTFDAIKHNPNALYAFLKKMPKGGELHYHLAGGAYPDAMLQAATTNSHYCIDKKTFALSEMKGACQEIAADEIDKHPEIYDQIIHAWSMKNFVPGDESGHDHFFATFYKFLPLVSNESSQLLVDIMQRAADQNEQYLEIMVMPDNARSAQFIPRLANNSIEYYLKMKQQLTENPNFKTVVEKTVTDTAQLIPNARKIMKCNKGESSNACTLTVKFQYYILREQPLNNFFSQAVHAFEVVSKSSDLVGINLVQPEDGMISLRDYQSQMEILSVLHNQYPKVHIALHAGELTNEFVNPNELRFHINAAVKIGHAERIGHGVDIAHENNADALADYMAGQHIAVEVNLTSNQRILNVNGESHPLNYYLLHHVPVVLSTDDEGILRTDLTEQYVKAVLEHKLSYPIVKQINRNALSYSFLPGKSLWQDDAEKNRRVNLCVDLKSPGCLNFVAQNEKARLQRILELKLEAFEALYQH